MNHDPTVKDLQKDVEHLFALFTLRMDALERQLDLPPAPMPPELMPPTQRKPADILIFRQRPV